MLQKLENLIEAGGDIEISIGNQKYTILPWTEKGIIIGLQETDEEQVFQTVDTLLDNYMIDGVPLRHLENQIKILFHS